MPGSSRKRYSRRRVDQSADRRLQTDVALVLKSTNWTRSQMAHHITGIIGHRDVLSRLQGHLADQPRFALAESFAFMPLDDENLDSIAGLHEEIAIADFVYLTPRLTEILKTASLDGEFAYIETEYFGGIGGQGAVLFRRGEVAFGPACVKNSTGPINEVLLRMGITHKPGAFDAFEVVGLAALRSNDDWRDEGTAV